MLGVAMMRAAEHSARNEMIERKGRYASLCAPTAWEIAKASRSMGTEYERVQHTARIAVELAQEISRLTAEGERR